MTNICSVKHLFLDLFCFLSLQISLQVMYSNELVNASVCVSVMQQLINYYISNIDFFVLAVAALVSAQRELTGNLD